MCRLNRMLKPDAISPTYRGQGKLKSHASLILVRTIGPMPRLLILLRSVTLGFAMVECVALLNRLFEDG